MAGERYDPDDNLVAESPPLQAVKVGLGYNEEMDWEPLKFDDHEYNGDGVFLKADPSLQVLYSYPVPRPEPNDQYEYSELFHTQITPGTVDRGSRR